MAQEKSTTNSEDTPDYGKVFFNWKFSEFPQYHRDSNWYVWGGIIVGFFLVYSFFTANLLFGLIVIISALLIIMFQRSNDEVEFKITEDGILVNNKFFEYKKIENFYIIYEPPEVKTLYFELTGFFNPRIPISFEDQNPVEVRDVLLKYLTEDLERENEPVSDQTSRMFKL
ncbi:MAG: hypothetical protein CMI53_02125 [Parcubacteria group bacterium]|jgi:hypothetical protein|nr:hypothetical protein [Parcubacteria group bacterium]|tara:strand:+ start:2438 stop:2950 length:513 start_codon:yes stop_codon:yes gene_type:complete